MASSNGWQCERFDNEGSAKVFKDAVDEAGQHWPPGWVKGNGYIAPTAADELRYRWSVESVGNRTASKGYKQQRIRALEMYMFSSRPRCRASAKRSAPQPRTFRGPTPPAGSARFAGCLIRRPALRRQPGLQLTPVPSTTREISPSSGPRASACEPVNPRRSAARAADERNGGWLTVSGGADVFAVVPDGYREVSEAEFNKAAGTIILPAPQ
ncbi:hypothetical protein OG609_10855 [Streptomyces sp. NBC_01224]|uniref:hypothetical protein n=1 Tax=Streptomyces sp. NBC_01224 TaxID=2903783 RepID=UPI002E161FE3|nr:hypothetical protein OG609_10855 [Streptomyces sp. NBC_01224]